MKKLIILIIVLFNIQLQSQEGVISYNVVISKDTNSTTEFSKKIDKEIEMSIFSLTFSASESYFNNIPHIPEDEISANIGLIKAHYYGYWYQSPTLRIAYFNKEIAGKEYLVVYENQMQGWELTNETKKIDNYSCYKATLIDYNERLDKETIIEAWYTPEIALPYGPVGYGGLPGLILELKYKDCIYISNKITLNPEKGIKAYPKPNMNNKIDSKEMTRLMKLARKVTED